MAMFTTQHYGAVAHILRIVGEIPEQDQRKQIGYALANLFHHDNPRFDMKRFLRIANLEN